MRSIFNFLVMVPLFISLISCEKNDNEDLICNVSNPAEELSWLKEKIDNLSQGDIYSYYAMANYKGQSVFYYGNCNPVVGYVSIVKDCSGNNLGYRIQLKSDLKNRTILWKHKDSKCQLPQ